MKINKRKIKLLLAVIAVFVSVVLFLYTRGVFQDKSLSQTPVNPSVTTAPFKIPQGETIEVSGIKIDNFYQSSEILNDNGDTSITKSNDFEIFYFPKTSQFLISITGSPFDTVRKNAEEKFSEIVGEVENICQLNVFITTPRYANPDQAGKSFKLSTCE